MGVVQAEMLRQENGMEFEALLGYRMSSRIVWSM